MNRILLLFSLMLLISAPAAGGEAVGVAVLEFSTKGGVTQQQMDALGDLLAAEIRGLGGFNVIGSNDIRAAFQLEERRRIMGCDDESCVAEVGGALGVRWVVIGNVGQFGQTFLMNLKLLDSREVKVVSAVSRSVKNGQDQLVEMLPAMVRDLFKIFELEPAPEKNPEPAVVAEAPARPLYTWGHATLWSGVGLAVLGGVAAWRAHEYGTEYDKWGKSSDLDLSRTWSGVMWAGFGLGAALIGTGVVLWLLEPADAPAAAAIVPLPQGAVFTLGGRW